MYTVFDSCPHLSWCRRRRSECHESFIHQDLSAATNQFANRLVSRGVGFVFLVALVSQWHSSCSEKTRVRPRVTGVLRMMAVTLVSRSLLHTIGLFLTQSRYLLASNAELLSQHPNIVHLLGWSHDSNDSVEMKQQATLYARMLALCLLYARMDGGRLNERQSGLR